MDLLVELAKKLDFSHGHKFCKEVLQLFGSSVHHAEASSAGSFFLLVTFHRYTFCLTEELVAFALASYLGGAPAGFHVQYLSDRHFKFLVPINKLVFMSTIFDISLVIILMPISIYGVMVQLIGNMKNIYGKLNRSFNGLWFYPRVKNELQNPRKKFILLWRPLDLPSIKLLLKSLFLLSQFSISIIP